MNGIITKLILLVLFTTSLCSCVTLPTKRMTEYTFEELIPKITIVDDSMENVAQLSTSRLFNKSTFLRVFIDKKSLHKSFQVYSVIKYSNDDWRYYNYSNYETPSGLKTSETKAIHSDVSCYSGAYVSCDHTEHVAFDVSEELLRYYSDRYKTNSKGVWQIRFKSRFGRNYDTMIPYSEIATLLYVSDKYSENYK